MAIDSRAKRSSVQSYALGFTQPPPDGTIALGDRAHIAFLYSGLSYSGPTVLTFLPAIRGWFGRLVRRPY